MKGGHGGRVWLLEGVVLLLVEGEGRREGWVRRDVELRHLSGRDGALRLQHVTVLCGAQTLAGDPLWQDLRNISTLVHSLCHDLHLNSH